MTVTPSKIHKYVDKSDTWVYDGLGKSDSSTEISSLKKRIIELDHIATTVLQELEILGQTDFIILKHNDIGEWWAKKRKIIQAKLMREAESERKRKVKEDALEKLRTQFTDEERKLLGFD